ncbi:MAG: DUF11 domain-containing protein [Tissierellales bacterium]|nr:DUF11 domain-containing protein [Tissierellales bacterium]
MISGRTRSYATGSLTNTVNVNSDVFDLNNADNSATASTMVNAKSDIYVTIKDNPDPVIADENLTYNLTVSNQGPSDAQNVVLAGSLPLPNLEYSLDDGVTWNKWNGSINLGNLVSGNLETILIHGKVASSATGTLSGTASVTADTTDANTQNNAFSETTAVNARADLFITGNDSPDPVIAGENLTYSITISNNGPSDALNVALTCNTALENIEYSLDNGNTWSNSLNIGTIATGGSKTVLIRGKVPSSILGSFTSTWNVNSNTEDLNLANNAFTEVTTVNTLADISVTMIDNPDPVSAGEELIYTINVSNLGPSDVRNVIVQDTLPSQLQNIQYSVDNGSTWGNWTGSLNLGTLSANSSKYVLIKGKIPSSTPDGSITNTASVTSDTLDLNSANNNDSESTTVNTRTDLAITITASNTFPHVGENIKLTLTVKNNGPSDATGVKTTYYLPYGLKHITISSNSYNPFNGLWSIGNLTSDSTVSLEVIGKVENVGLVNNTATVSGSQVDPNTVNNSANVLLSVYPNHWSPWNVNPGNGGHNHPGNGGSSHNGGNHYGNIGKFIPGLGLGGISVPPNSNNFSIYGPLAPYLIGNGNPLSGLFKYDEEAWKINNQGSLYGSFAGILNNPFNPFNFQFYAADKLIQAGQKAWQSGNIWDFFDYNFYHFYGYSNLDKMWGGENIKALLYWGFGIDENGNMSIGNFLLNMVAIIPIGRAGTVVGKFLAGALEKAGIKIGVNLGDNIIINKIGNFLSDLTKKFDLWKPETWKNAISWVGNVLLPNPVGWAADILKGLAKLTGNEKLIAIATAFSNFEFNRGLGDLGNLLISSDPIKKVLSIYGEVGGFLNRNLNYLVDSTKKFVNGAVNVVKASVRNLVNKISSTVKQLVPKVVSTVKKVVNKVFTNVNTVVKKVVNKAKTVVKKVVYKARTVAKKVFKTFKKVVNKAKTVVKKAANTVKKAFSSAVNWVKSKIRWLW